ncbi:L-histidine N(alpha)-methyltransferase, partial [Streptomyces umbrinus]
EGLVLAVRTGRLAPALRAYAELLAQQRALWDAEREWIEMRLRARSALTVKIPALDLAVDFAEGEEMRTEVSAKFREDGVRTELAAVGLDLTHWWTDPQGRFALSLSTAR